MESRVNNVKRVLTVLIMGVIAYGGLTMMPFALMVIPGLLIMQWMAGEKSLAVASVVSMGVAAGFWNLLHLAIIFGPLTIWLIYTVSTKKSGLMIYLGGVFFSIFGVVAWLSWVSGGIGSVDLKGSFDAVLKLQQENMEAAGLNVVDVERTMEVLRAGASLLHLYLPSTLIIYGLSLPYISLVIAGRALLKRGIVIFQPASFFLFKLPPNIVPGTVVTFIGFLLLKSFMGDLGSVVLVNLIAIFSFLFLIQGLSVVDFWITSKGGKRMVKVLAVTFCIIMPLLNITVIIIGFIDSAFNLRKI